MNNYIQVDKQTTKHRYLNNNRGGRTTIWGEANNDAGREVNNGVWGESLYKIWGSIFFNFSFCRNAAFDLMILFLPNNIKKAMIYSIDPYNKQIVII